MRLEDFDNDEDRIIQDQNRKTGMKSGRDSWAILKLWPSL
jgi:hypothetical protein